MFAKPFATEGDYIVYDIGTRFRSFHAIVGVRDDHEPSRDRPSTFKILGDGVELASGAVLKNGKLIVLDVDVTGVKALRIDTNNFATIANPTLSEKPATENRANRRPKLVSPEDHSILSGQNVPFTWTDVPGATKYLVQIVLVDKKGDSEHDEVGWSLTSRLNSCNWAIKGMPPGDYVWFVLALDDRKALGKLSSQGYFSYQP